jgi:hypothetical protein
MSAAKLPLALFITAALPGCATWTPETRIEEGAYQALHAVDGLETLRIADDPAHMYEDVSPFLGKHPAPHSVVALFAVTSVGHFGVTELLVRRGAPPWVLRTWEGIGIGVEAACVTDNYAHHVTPTFSVRYRVNPAPR